MSVRLDVALATCLKLPERDPDEGLLTSALAESGIRSRSLAWDDPEAGFGSAAMTVLRSTWAYPSRVEEFRRWLEETAAVSELWNPLPAVRWNLHKRYLLELEAGGIPAVPTVLLSAGAEDTLATLSAERDWEVMVVKPAISANSMNTIRVDAANASDMERGERHLRKLLTAGDVLVQPYLESVEAYGECAVIWIDGELTHAVRKSPRFTGSAEDVSKEPLAIRADEARCAERVVAFVQEKLATRLLYARVDLARLAPEAPGLDGPPAVMELDLIEPSLYFAQSPRARSIDDIYLGDAAPAFPKLRAV